MLLPLKVLHLNPTVKLQLIALHQQRQLDSRHDFVEYFKFKKGRDSPGETRSALLVVAALVATTSFQFGVNPPGGVW